MNVIHLLFLALLFVAHGFSANATEREITTSKGTLVGVIEGDLVSFKGIPYAAPPVGELRWRAPQPVASWNEKRAADDYGPICPQQRPTRLPEDEDCLTLNVWAPAETRAEKLLPVMVWIHGGSHVNGSGRMDGSTFARDGVVMVAINYRLGRFGVFGHPELTAARAGGEPTANFAILDQIAALKWVQREIRAFGGDPGRVTIFGVSAGGSYVNLLMASPLAEGLFHGAIAQSGANGLSRSRDLKALEAFGQRFEERQEVKGLAGLRALPWRSLVEQGASYRIESDAVIDGVVLTNSVPDTFAAGRQQNVPYMAGANSFEGSLAVTIPIPAYLRIMNENIDEVTRRYGLAANDPALYLQFYGDILFVAPTRHLVRQMRTVASPAWLYHFDYVLASVDPLVPGARHAGEVPFVFDRLQPLSINAAAGQRFGMPAGEYPVSDRDHEVARMMHGYWVQFAKTGSPNRVDQPVWPAYDKESDVALVISNDGLGAASNVRRAQLDLIEDGYNNPQ
ncbi:MAG: carboxylesterase/lipase family protein [Pseudomonadota bacterium]